MACLRHVHERGDDFGVLHVPVAIAMYLSRRMVARAEILHRAATGFGMDTAPCEAHDVGRVCASRVSYGTVSHARKNVDMEHGEYGRVPRFGTMVAACYDTRGHLDLIFELRPTVYG